ncbi:hypothetical protein PAXRUDRAFT_150104 [Paxillus rubicundulus Ve08.2h10]|uniref:Uncharacterized protein n=1 Tax=Paxillus rubicundulus Ve08.2h10 TaxID=930991 RepID=A0A0D0D3U6_9AGAM|nr:hypothetical protein PAXRUDRAFT_177172 [Paxillus rubicundulus Ve08.2h10]KIK91172.1 hypothetical protein PAXRUDRAFT_150104 [Paxillus rubicundulus Ve08.2h10]
MEPKSTTKQQEKSLKTKELLFPLNKDNYIEFLENILKKHGQTQYKVSSKQQFSFKFTLPKTKRYCSYCCTTLAGCLVHNPF